MKIVIRRLNGPVIAVITDDKPKYHDDNTSKNSMKIPAAYVNAIEATGGRVVPLVYT